MAVTYSTVTQLGLFSQQYPPPLLPKPGKDNLRLQKLLKRSAKRKASVQASQSATPFRSSLSPVNEASPDLEYCDHSTPPKTPETLPSYYNIQPAPRFTVRPLYQHVASPYPQQAAYGRATRLSPQTVVPPSFPYSQLFTTVASLPTSIQVSEALATVEQVTQPTVASTPRPSSFTSEGIVTVTEPKKQTFGTNPESHSGLRPVTAVATPPCIPKSPGPALHSIPSGQAVILPLTVLTSIMKCRSPRPTFKAAEHSKSPKPMFDVPQIRMYTASTSYYETSRTPPVYDTAGLTAIGSTAPHSKISTETRKDLHQASEVRRGVTASQPPSLGTNAGRKTPVSEVKRATPPVEIKQQTPALEMKRATPSEVPVKVSRTSAGRAKTPVDNATQATSLASENSTCEPLCAELQMSAGSEGSRSLPIKTTELPEILPNGDIHSDTKPATKSEQILTKPEPDPKGGAILTSKVASHGAEAITSILTTQVIAGYQRPKTPTYEASRLMTRSPVYKRPKTPVSPVDFKRPKTPVSLKSKPTYYGLTPAEYAAHGGIKTSSPAFGFSSSSIQTQEEVKAQAPGKRSVEQQNADKTSKVNERSNDMDGHRQEHKTVSSTASVPLIVVSQPSDSSESAPKQHMSQAAELVEAKQDTLMIQEIQTSSTEMNTISENQEFETLIEESQPTTKTPENKHPPSKGSDPDGTKTGNMFFGKVKIQTDEEKAKADKETSVSATKIKLEGSKAQYEVTTPALLATTAELRQDKEKQKEKTEKTSAVKFSLEQKKDNETLPEAESLLIVMKKPKGLKSKMNGWSRLKKHMVVEQEEPKFPEVNTPKETRGQDQGEEIKLEGDKPNAQEETQTKDTPKVTKMWDAVLFQMFSTKENIMHQIELNKSDGETKDERKDEPKEIPSFAYKLPVLLFSPRFDAKKLKEAASRPVTKISTVFEMGLIGRKGKEEEPKDFNRTARGFTTP
ncbi:neurofilament heavy polypeptide [Nothobranchius furzeri]|uniref:Serine/arginine repetitive matrix protein 1-like n=4 Tax=Nothobranchius furzeri TaxID=105023 RepID=A0A9D2Y6I1_NOTFU|nr:mucin-2 [Nothobranchius furzeri]KAF7215101.1 serine/arginine repetitive matrix protein 1-like [Nothobranchius furzeri]